jgi:hypothetical protein
MAKHTFIVEVEADEADGLAATEDIRHALAHIVWSAFRPGRTEAPVVGVRIDGRQYDFVSGKLATPINADIARMIAENRIIPAIKELRANDPGLSVGDAMRLVDNWKVSR